MYTVDELDSLVKSNSFPDENRITLKLYCEYYDKYIKNMIYDVGDLFKVVIKPSQIAHIMDIHAFYDKNTKHKVLRFKGAFTTIEAYRNMKNRIIDIQVLKSS